MVNLAEKHDGEHSVQLADAEISRVLSTLKEAEFKRAATGNERPDQTFKPRSLMEIAQTAKQEDEVAKAAAISAEIADHKAAHVADQIINDTVDDVALENTDDDQSHEQRSAGVLDHSLQDTGPEIPLAELNAPDSQDLPETDVGGGAGVGFDNSDDNEIDNLEDDPASQISPSETAQTAYDRGYADGSVASREADDAKLRATIGAEFEAKFADKINAFETALIGLAKPQTLDTGALSKSLQAAVIRLAAARAGAAIDEMPELMVARIESLADSAGKHVAAGHVFMHPDDCAVIAPIMETRQDQLKIEPDPDLYRGDVRIRFDGMEISDVADLRADWQISQLTERENFVEVETAQTKISDVESETPIANNLSLDSPGASVQSSTISPSLQDGENREPTLDDIEDNEDASSSEAIGLMPLTTTGGDDPELDEGAGDNEGTSSSEAIGLMPLTSKKLDE